MLQHPHLLPGSVSGIRGLSRQVEHLSQEALDYSIWPDILLAAYRTSPRL